MSNNYDSSFWEMWEGCVLWLCFSRVLGRGWVEVSVSPRLLERKDNGCTAKSYLTMPQNRMQQAPLGDGACLFQRWREGRGRA